MTPFSEGTHCAVCTQTRVPGDSQCRGISVDQTVCNTFQVHSPSGSHTWLGSSLKNGLQGPAPREVMPPHPQQAVVGRAWRVVRPRFPYRLCPLLAREA